MKSKGAKVHQAIKLAKRSGDKDARHAPIRVSIVEDEEWMGEYLSCEIGRSPALRYVSRYHTAGEALRGIPIEHPDVVLMDANLPGMDGVECVRRLKLLLPETQFVMLTVCEESDRTYNVRLAGTSGYLLKRSDSKRLLKAILQASSDGTPVSFKIVRKVLHDFNPTGNAPELAGLSPRECDVLESLAKGASYKEIADQLSLTIETIRMNVKHLYSKLHVHSRTEAVAKYMAQTWR